MRNVRLLKVATDAAVILVARGGQEEAYLFGSRMYVVKLPAWP